MTGVKSLFGAQMVMAATAISAAVAGAWLAWHHAPPVGGEWWPYVRVAVSIVAGIIGAKLGALVGFLVGIGLVLVFEVLLR